MGCTGKVAFLQLIIGIHGVAYTATVDLSFQPAALAGTPSAPWRYYAPVFAPAIHVQLILSHPARPQALYEESRAVLFCGRLIHSFDLDHRHRHLEMSTYMFFRCGLHRQSTPFSTQGA
jgi:hypothetical protein